MILSLRYVDPKLSALKNPPEFEFSYCKKRGHQAAHLVSNITQRKQHCYWKNFLHRQFMQTFFPGFSDIIERHLTRNDLRLTLKRRHKLSLRVPEFTVAEI